jgi:hypothetical protein
MRQSFAITSQTSPALRRRRFSLKIPFLSGDDFDRRRARLQSKIRMNRQVAKNAKKI